MTDVSTNGCGWASSLRQFCEAPTAEIVSALQRYLPNASPEQLYAWEDSVPKLQAAVARVLEVDPDSADGSVILEYQLPLESRRPDAIVLTGGAVVVLEFKARSRVNQVDLDQTAAYARDLRNYHRDCVDREVCAATVPTKAHGNLAERDGVHVVGFDYVDELILEARRTSSGEPPELDAFLTPAAYSPLPSLVDAARELFASGTVRRIHRSWALPESAVEEIARITHEASQDNSRRLILVSGVPGSGKTLVGLRTVHAHFLKDLANGDVDATSPAIFLSGNKPLVDVLRYELKSPSGADGKTFVGHVRDYRRTFAFDPSALPPHRVVVFDEAQRAWDQPRVAAEYKPAPNPRSEPEHFVEFAERGGDWRVLVGLIGEGQEINAGEEAGLLQWRHAIEGCKDPSAWIVHASGAALEVFSESDVHAEQNDDLHLRVEVRFHFVNELDGFVERLLRAEDANGNRALAERIRRSGYRLRITRDLALAKDFMRRRYADNPETRFGILASSRDKALVRLGVPNDYPSTKDFEFGPWYGDGDESPQSCRRLDRCVTEYGAQGLELDAVLLAWGTDLMLERGTWTNRLAGRYAQSSDVKDPFQLRLNAYRVLLTRGRDATVVFVPELDTLDETHDYLTSSGFIELRA